MAEHPGLRAEDAAVFGYGLILPQAGPTIVAAVERMLGEHRDRTDQARLLWPDADPAAPGYTLDAPLATSTDALLIAVRLESDCCEGWRAWLEHAQQPSAAQLAFAQDSLDAAAIQMARWRTLIPGAPFTALPGFPAPR